MKLDESHNQIGIKMEFILNVFLRPLLFRMQYEFVDLHQDGEAYDNGACYRKFVSRTRDSLDIYSQTPKQIRSPRDVFLFGRGGVQTLE